MCRTEEGVQYDGGYSVRNSQAIIADEAHLRYRQGCPVPICHTISMDEGAQYRITKTAQGVVGGCIYLGE